MDDDDPRLTGRLRRQTYPLGGFLAGLLLTQPPRDATPENAIITSLFAAVTLAILAWIVALMRRGPTSTYLPSGERPLLNVIFGIALVATVYIKVEGLQGAIPVLICFIPVAIIMGGGGRLLERRQALRRDEMMDRLRVMADDPNESDAMRDKARDRLERLERLES